MATNNSTPSINSLADDVARNLNDVSDLIELMYETYGGDAETKVGALCTATLRILAESINQIEQIESVSKGILIEKGSAA